MSTKQMTYNEAYQELQDIMAKMEADELDVDTLAGQVKRAAELIKYCKAKLHETETEITRIIEDMEDS